MCSIVFAESMSMFQENPMSNGKHRRLFYKIITSSGTILQTRTHLHTRTSLFSTYICTYHVVINAVK